MLWIINRLVRNTMHNRLTRFFEYLSQRVTALYVLQWTLVCWGMGVVGYQTLNPWQTMAMMPLMVILTLTCHALLARGLVRLAAATLPAPKTALK